MESYDQQGPATFQYGLPKETKGLSFDFVTVGWHSETLKVLSGNNVFLLLSINSQDSGVPQLCLRLETP